MKKTLAIRCRYDTITGKRRWKYGADYHANIRTEAEKEVEEICVKMGLTMIPAG